MELQPHDHLKGLFDGLVADGYEGRVTVRTRGHGEVTGRIGPTGNHAVIIRGLVGRDFYDAYVPYDAIDRVEVQTRS
jgi:hypothetical protein